MSRTTASGSCTATGSASSRTSRRPTCSSSPPLNRTSPKPKSTSGNTTSVRHPLPFLTPSKDALTRARSLAGIGDFVLATTYFEHAIRHDGVRQADTFQSYYYLAELASRAVNRADQCPTSVSFYKVVAERGDWDHEVWWEAERALGRGDERLALLGYWIMAERGYEAAQNNVAWILDRGAFPPFLLSPFTFPPSCVVGIRIGSGN